MHDQDGTLMFFRGSHCDSRFYDSSHLGSDQLKQKDELILGLLELVMDQPKTHIFRSHD